MRDLAKILGLGFLAFLAVAMTQEWAVFRPWILGKKAPARQSGPDEARRRDAEAAVRQLLSMASHYYASRNDPRFLERMPARGWVVDEMRADVEYLLRNGRIQQMKLAEVEILGVDVRGERLAQVRTRESWKIQTVSAEGTGEGDPEQASTLECRYTVALVGRAWQVTDWDLAVVPPSVPVAAPVDPAPASGGAAR